MTIVIFICGLLSFAYLLLMLTYRLGWKQQQLFVLPEQYKPNTSITVIVPARNEEKNIGACIDSILRQNYPEHLLEVIVIDDHSTDRTTDIVKSFRQARVRCINLAERIMDSGEIIAYKKKALSIGVADSTGELIVTTDADCVMHKEWLLHIAAKYEQEKPVMIIAPVQFSADGTAVQLFQSLDFMGMQGITAAAHRLNMGNMSNGANLAFSKAAFYEVDGYNGIDHIASGDDYLLMMKMKKKFPNGISYLKSKQVIVSTPPQPDWTRFFQQRIRWSSKLAKYDDARLASILIFAYVFNISFLFLFIVGCFSPVYLGVAAIMLFIKWIADLLFLYPVVSFFNNQKQLILSPVFQPLHIIYVIAAGLLGFIGVYSWKGRRVR